LKNIKEEKDMFNLMFLLNVPIMPLGGGLGPIEIDFPCDIVDP